MNNFLDTKLKIMRFFRKNKKKIIIIFIIWTIIISINYYLKYRPKEIVFKNTYKPHSPIIDTTDSVPISYQKTIEKLINDYIEYCNNKEYENAYNLLSSDFKLRYCRNIEDFKIYVDNAFEKTRKYSIQNYSNINNKYVYKVNMFDDIMANGTTDGYFYNESKYVISEENGELKISLNGYCGKQDLDIDVEDDYMQITFVRKEIEYDKSDYIIKIKNKTKNYIVLSDEDLKDAIQLKFPDEVRTATNLANSNIVIGPDQTNIIDIWFDEFFDDKQEPLNLILNSIQILPKYSGLEENREKERENAVKLYSLSIDMIAK